MTTTIFSVLLTKYTLEYSLDKSIAEEQLGAALAAGLDIAIDDLRLSWRIGL